MKIFNYILYLIAACTTLSACNSNEDFVKTEPDNLPDGGYVQRVDFRNGDEDTRSSFVFDNNVLKAGWIKGDKLGIYPTYNTVETDAKKVGPTTPGATQQGCFELAEGGEGYIHIDNTDITDFTWADGFKRTAYFPYNKSFSPYNGNNKVLYNSIPFSFEGQTQTGYVNMGAFYKGDASGGSGYTNPNYKQSEVDACEHLATSDFLVSPEKELEGTRIRFPMHHLGAIARFFLLAPKENMLLKTLRLVATKPIFFTKGTVDLSSTQYDPNAADENDGLKLVSQTYTTDENRQMKPVESSKTSVLELSFGDNMKTYYSTATPYGNYLIAYLMMYPVNTAGCEMYVYLEAETLDASGNPTGTIKKYRTDNINTTPKNMFSGCYYQWTYRTLDDEHPIELTATEIPWQDVVGGSINLGEEE